MTLPHPFEMDACLESLDGCITVCMSEIATKHALGYIHDLLENISRDCGSDTLQRIINWKDEYLEDPEGTLIKYETRDRI